MTSTVTPVFEMYDILMIDWRDGKGWGEYVVLKSQTDFNEAVRIVRGADCQAMPHWIRREDVRFCIMSAPGTQAEVIKLAE